MSVKLTTKSITLSKLLLMHIFVGEGINITLCSCLPHLKAAWQCAFQQ